MRRDQSWARVDLMNLPMHPCSATAARDLGSDALRLHLVSVLNRQSRNIYDCRHHCRWHGRVEESLLIDVGEMACRNNDGTFRHISLDQVAWINLSW